MRARIDPTTHGKAGQRVLELWSDRDPAASPFAADCNYAWGLTASCEPDHPLATGCSGCCCFGCGIPPPLPATATPHTTPRPTPRRLPLARVPPPGPPRGGPGGTSGCRGAAGRGGATGRRSAARPLLRLCQGDLHARVPHVQDLKAGMETMEAWKKEGADANVFKVLHPHRPGEFCYPNFLVLGDGAFWCSVNGNSRPP